MKLQGRLLIEFIQAVHLDLFFQVYKSREEYRFPYLQTLPKEAYSQNCVGY